MNREVALKIVLALVGLRARWPRTQSGWHPPLGVGNVVGASLISSRTLNNAPFEAVSANLIASFVCIFFLLFCKRREFEYSSRREHGLSLQCCANYRLHPVLRFPNHARYARRDEVIQESVATRTEVAAGSTQGQCA
jgi:hypothetical protein